MKTKEKFYACAGYYSLPFSFVPLVTVTFLHCFGCIVPLICGAMGLWFTISGIFKGGWGARFCALVSLLIFLHLGLSEFAYNASF